MNLKIDSSGFSITVLIIGTLILFYIYHYFVHSQQLEKIFEERFKHNHQKKEVLFFLTKKFSGFLIMGVLGGILYRIFYNFSFLQFGLQFSHVIVNLIIILILITVVVSITFLSQWLNRNQNLVQMDIKDWTPGLFLIDAVGWTVYLTGYEFLFRGILLFECYGSFGFWPAIAVNVAIYSAIHMVNGKSQAIGALIFGTIACYFTLICGTILIPIFMHITLSTSADFFSIKLNKNLSFFPVRKYKIPQK